MYGQKKLMLSCIKLSRYLHFLCRFQWEIFLAGTALSVSIHTRSTCSAIVPPACPCLRSLSSLLRTHVSAKPQPTNSNASLL